MILSFFHAGSALKPPESLVMANLVSPTEEEEMVIESPMRRGVRTWRLAPVFTGVCQRILPFATSTPMRESPVRWTTCRVPASVPTMSEAYAVFSLPAVQSTLPDFLSKATSVPLVGLPTGTKMRSPSITGEPLLPWRREAVSLASGTLLELPKKGAAQSLSKLVCQRIFPSASAKQRNSPLQVWV